jgi:hypothetical protein
VLGNDDVSVTVYLFRKLKIVPQNKQSDIVCGKAIEKKVFSGQSFDNTKAHSRKHQKKSDIVI